TYDAGASTPTSLVFDYTVAPGEDTSALAILDVRRDNAAIRDGAGANVDLAGALATFDDLTVDTIPPKVTSFTAPDPPLYVPNSTVHWTLTFTEPVTGVTAADFTLSSTGTISGAQITGVTPVNGSNGTQYTVVATTGTGSGVLDLKLTGTIHDPAGNALPANGAFKPAQTKAVRTDPDFAAVAPLPRDA